MQQEYNRQDLIIASLTQQVANLVGQLAEKDAIITEQQIELKQVRDTQIKEMDKDTKNEQ